MSEALYEFGGLRFWSDAELNLRELVQNRIIYIVKQTLHSLNSAWVFERIEGPCLTPKSFISSAYSDNDVFVTNHEIAKENLRLRAETTASSYKYAKKHYNSWPVCIYQIGKSFRRELNDGASAAKLRFNEFNQLEFQCIYALNTKADYREELIKAVDFECSRLMYVDTKIEDSERLPSYSESTKDILVKYKDDWIEIASCSIRNDFSSDTKVCEIALGLDRIVDLTKGY